MNAVSGAVQAASNRSSIGPMMSMSCAKGAVVHSKNAGGGGFACTRTVETAAQVYICL